MIMTGILMITMKRELNDTQVRQIYTKFKFDYDKTDGNKDEKIKAIVVHCMEVRCVDELIRACIEVKPDSNWQIPESNVELKVNIIPKLIEAANKFESETSTRLPSWWSNFKVSLVSQQEEDYDKWVTTLPAEQREMLTYLFRTLREGVASKLRAELKISKPK